MANRTADKLVAREILLGKGKSLAAAADKKYPRTSMDRVVSKISPALGARRDQRRMANTIMAGGYDITTTSRKRRSRGNRSADGSADNSLDDRTLWELREWCRNHDRNSPLLHGIIGRAADNIAAPKYVFSPDSGDAAFDSDAAAMLEERTEAAEYRGRFGFQDMIYLTIRTLFTDGDLFFNHLKDGSIQVIEAHELVTPSNGKGYKDRVVIGGIEIDEKGRSAALYVANPKSKGFYGGGWVSNWQTAQRLDMANVTHIANRHRFSQTRGVPVLAAGLETYEMLDSYLDSEMLAAKIDADIVRYLKRPAASGEIAGTLPNTDPETEDNFSKLLKSEPGSIVDLMDGEEIASVGGNRPGETFEPYVMTILRIVGASVGFPLELVLLDFSKTNYSSARAALLQSYRVFMRWQQYLQRAVIGPTYNRWIQRSLASSAMRVVDKPYRLKYTPPRWGWIDPLKSVLANDKAIAAGAKTLSSWITEEGQIPEQVFDAREKELAALREKMIPTTTAPNNISNQNNGDSNNASQKP